MNHVGANVKSLKEVQKTKIIYPIQLVFCVDVQSQMANKDIYDQIRVYLANNINMRSNKSKYDQIRVPWPNKINYDHISPAARPYNVLL